MTTFEMIMSALNIIAVVTAPIVAVVVGQHLQDRSQKRKDKMDVFKTLMANRVGWSTSSVYAMNIIEVVFCDDNEVRDCWKTYYEKLCIQSPDEMQQKQTQAAHYRLLEAMAKSLGYKNKITWEEIQNPYIPKGMVDAITQQQMIQSGQETLAGSIGQVISHMMGMPTPQIQTDTQEEKPHAHT